MSLLVSSVSPLRPLLPVALLLFLSSVACAQEQARASCCLCLVLSLDDLTMPPYSPHPLPPTTPLSGNIHIFLAESKCWLWLVLLSSRLFFSSFLSVLLLRDTDQVNRAHHTTLHYRERLVVSPFWRSRPRVFFLFLFCVHKPLRYISARAVCDLAGSL